MPISTLCLTALLAAGFFPQDVEPDGPADVVIEVLDRFTGAPIEGVVIGLRDLPSESVFDLPDQSGRSDGSGLVRFDEVGGGPFWILSDRGTGLVWEEVPESDDAEIRAQLLLPAGAKGGGSAVGVVRDASGEPVAGASIYVGDLYGNNGFGAVAVTGADGRFKVDHVRTLSRVWARKKGQLRSEHVEVSLADLVLGQEVDLTLGAAASPLHVLVLGRDGKPVQDAPVQLFEESRPKSASFARRRELIERLSKRTDDQGIAVFDLEGGSKFVAIVTPLSGPKTVLESSLGESVDGRVTLQIAEATALKGTVTNDSGAPLGGIQIVATRASKSFTGKRRLGSARTAEDGTYLIEEIAAGEVQVNGYHDTLRDPGKVSSTLVLAAGETGVWDVAAAALKSSISGVVVAPGLAPGEEIFVRVSAVSPTNKVTWKGKAMTRAGRPFRVACPAEGTYTVQAMVFNDTSRNHYVEGVLPGTKDLEIEIPDTLAKDAAITGRVVFQASEPGGAALKVPGRSFVVAHRMIGNGAISYPHPVDGAMGLIQDDGSFSLQGLRADDFALWLLAPGYAAEQLDVVTARKAKTLELPDPLTVQESARVRLTIELHDGLADGVDLAFSVDGGNGRVWIGNRFVKAAKNGTVVEFVLPVGQAIRISSSYDRTHAGGCTVGPLDPGSTSDAIHQVRKRQFPLPLPAKRD